MTITEVKTTIIELSDEEKEILCKAANILDELYDKDYGNRIFYDLLEEKDYDFSDLNDISSFLNLMYEKNSFSITKAD